MTAESGMLLIYNHPDSPNAATVMNHVESFGAYSRFPVVRVNTDLAFPSELAGRSFQVVVLHYSLFGAQYSLDSSFRAYLRNECAGSYKVAFFQDEHHYCQQRFRFLNENAIDCVYTCIEPQHLDKVYRKYTTVPKFVHTLTGYVSEHMLDAARRFAKPDSQRTIDVSYRGRELSIYMGRGSREKAEIAAEFQRRAEGLGLALDLRTKENERLYGNKWWKLIGNSRGVLGVEAGVSIFDLEDIVRTGFEALVTARPEMSDDEIRRTFLEQFENNVPYRTVSPRHLEAAAFRCCQILYEGDYTGVLTADVHYLALRKDFSNFDDVIRRFRDPQHRKAIVDRAHRDIIASGRWTYQRFVEDFDEQLAQAGILPAVERRSETVWRRKLRRTARYELWRRRWNHATHGLLYRIRWEPFPGRALLKAAVSPILSLLRRRAHSA